jgi:hypothetical protein
MTIYTAVPLELVLDGIQNEPGPFAEVTVRGMKMQVEPIAPGIGRIVRLLDAPLNSYLRPELTPGSTVHYADAGTPFPSFAEEPL